VDKKSTAPRSQRLILLLGTVLLLVAGYYFTSDWYREKIAWLFAVPSQRLIQAAVVNNVDAARQALAAGADVDSSVYNRWTALNLAAHEGYDAMVGLLLAAHANPEISNIFGSTPLAVAAYEGRQEIVRQLLQAGANPNTVTTTGNTPLHLAITTGHTAAIPLLLRYGARVNCKNESGSTPLDFAVNQQDVPTVRLLLAHGAHPDSDKRFAERDSTPPLARAAFYGNLACAVILLQYPIDLNQPDNRGNTPLHEAVKHHREAMVKLLLFCRADPTRRNRRGETPLTLASRERIGILLALENATVGWKSEIDRNSDKNVQQRNIVFAAAAQRKLQ